MSEGWRSGHLPDWGNGKHVAGAGEALWAVEHVAVSIKILFMRRWRQMPILSFFYHCARDGELQKS